MVLFVMLLGLLVIRVFAVSLHCLLGEGGLVQQILRPRHCFRKAAAWAGALYCQHQDMFKLTMSDADTRNQILDFIGQIVPEIHRE